MSNKIGIALDKMIMVITCVLPLGLAMYFSFTFLWVV